MWAGPTRPGPDYVRSSKSSIVRSLDFMVSAIGSHEKFFSSGEKF